MTPVFTKACAPCDRGGDLITCSGFEGQIEDLTAEHWSKKYAARGVQRLPKLEQLFYAMNTKGLWAALENCPFPEDVLKIEPNGIEISTCAYPRNQCGRNQFDNTANYAIV